MYNVWGVVYLHTCDGDGDMVFVAKIINKFNAAATTSKILQSELKAHYKLFECFFFICLTILARVYVGGHHILYL